MRLLHPVTLAAASLVLWAMPARSANYAHPYSNVDRSNDAGNDTGDSRVDALNNQQLNENYKGPYYYGSPPPPGMRPPLRRPAPPPPPPPGY